MTISLLPWERCGNISSGLIGLCSFDVAGLKAQQQDGKRLFLSCGVQRSRYCLPSFAIAEVI